MLSMRCLMNLYFSAGSVGSSPHRVDWWGSIPSVGSILVGSRQKQHARPLLIMVGMSWLMSSSPGGIHIWSSIMTGLTIGLIGEVGVCVTASTSETELIVVL